MDINNPSFIAAIAAIASLVGASLPHLTKLVTDLFTTRKTATSDMMQQQFDEIRKERQDNSERTQSIVNDLQKQIFDLRQQVIDLQKANFSYVQENAELKAKVLVLTHENEILKQRISELSIEIKETRGVIQ